jgi:hypothetical protein
MKKEVLYEYLGTNGTITSPIHLEDIYYVRKLKLIADNEKVLTNSETGVRVYSVTIPESELEYWSEISILGQE